MDKMGAVLHRENVDGTLTSPCSDSEQKAIKKSSGEISWLPFTYLRNYYYFIHLIKKKKISFSVEGVPLLSLHTFLRSLPPPLLPGSSQQERETAWDEAVGKSLCMLSVQLGAGCLSESPCGEAEPLGSEH